MEEAEHIQHIDQSMQETLRVLVMCIQKFTETTEHVTSFKAVKSDQSERLQQALQEKKALEHKLLAHEKIIREQQREIKELKAAYAIQGMELDNERDEKTKLREMLESQSEDWRTKFTASQEEIENLTAALSNAQIAPRPPRKSIREKPTAQQVECDPVSEDRQKVLETWPADRAGDIPEEAHSNPVGFTRLELMSTLGGGGQTLIGNIAKNKDKTEISRLHDVNGMLYPYRDLNPWLPKAPGEHGYMFVGLRGPGGDHERFRETEERALFIPVGSSWRYYGHYEVFRDPTNDLSVTEWSVFSDDFKHRYAEMTLSKRMAGAKFTDLKKSKPKQVEKEIQDIIRDYDAGKLRVPLVQLCCVKYDHGLVLALHKASKKALGKRKGAKGAKRKGDTPAGASSSQPRPRKRARTERDVSPARTVNMEEGPPQERRRFTRNVRLIVRDPQGRDLVDEGAESSASDPDEYEDSGSE